MNIPQMRADAEQKIREAKHALTVARAGLDYVRACCPHPSPRKWTTSCMGDTGTAWKCDQCGLEKHT